MNFILSQDSKTGGYENHTAAGAASPCCRVGMAVHRPRGQRSSLEVAHWERVRVTVFPCSWTTRLHKDSMMVDSDTTGEAVSAIYMYIYI